MTSTRQPSGPCVHGTRWRRSSDLVPRHVYQGELHGRELAVWRADDGFVNVWENRCLHRGVRLTIGGQRRPRADVPVPRVALLQPHRRLHLHPGPSGGRPGADHRQPTYPAVERYGLVWTTLDGDAPTTSLRSRTSVPRSRCGRWSWPPSASVVDELRGTATGRVCGLADGDELRLRFTGVADLTLFVQPAGETPLCRARRAPRRPARVGPDRVLRRHHRLLTRIRDRVEAAFADRPRAPLRAGVHRLPLSARGDARRAARVGRRTCASGWPASGSRDRCRRLRARRSAQ